MHRLRNSVETLSQSLSTIGSQGVAVAAMVIAMVALLLVPIPTALLDILLVTNIVIALVLLLVSLFSSSEARFYAFPTILLLTTLFRLALNVSSTRLILLNGDEGLHAAGRMIESFGMFVVQGDFVVGVIIFAIIAIVNFVVITKGSSRVAEVSARFTLDALPGKQLAIDADLRAGNITQEQASVSRAQLSNDAQFYGAMDGAMKFVQGDAVAGLLITFVNAVGGVSIGVSRGQGFSEAIDTFGILTIGDGLLSVLPSLLISVCAGIVVTRVTGAGQRNAGEDIFQHVVAVPQALIISAIVLLALGLVPGFPLLPFFLVGFGLLAINILSRPDAKVSADSSSGGLMVLGSAPLLLEHREGSAEADGIYWMSYEPASINVLQVEYDSKYLGDCLDERSNQSLLQYFIEAQHKVYQTRGIRIPDIALKPSDNLSRGTYRILVRDQLVRTGELKTDQVFASASKAVLQVLGLQVQLVQRHPSGLRQGAWISQNQSGLGSLERLGVELLSPYEYLAHDVVGAALRVIEELVGVSEVKQLIHELKKDHPLLVEEVFDSAMLSYPECTEVVKRLIREGVNVRDMKLIVEGIAEFSSRNQDPMDRQEWLAELHSFLRVVLARGIISDALGPSGKLRTFVLSNQIEAEFREANSMWERGKTRPPLDPEMQQAIKKSAVTMFAPVLERGGAPIVVLCSGEIRAAVQEFFHGELLGADWLKTICYEELNVQHTPESVGVLTL